MSANSLNRQKKNNKKHLLLNSNHGFIPLPNAVSFNTPNNKLVRKLPDLITNSVWVAEKNL